MLLPILLSVDASWVGLAGGWVVFGIGACLGDGFGGGFDADFGAVGGVAGLLFAGAVAGERDVSLRLILLLRGLIGVVGEVVRMLSAGVLMRALCCAGAVVW